MDWRMEDNIMKGISDIVSNLKKQHAEEISLLNHQHKEVVQELLKQSQTEQQNHAQALKEAREQVKYARWGFYVAFLALIVTIGFNVYTTCFSNNSTNKKGTMVQPMELFQYDKHTKTRIISFNKKYQNEYESYPNINKRL